MCLRNIFGLIILNLFLCPHFVLAQPGDLKAEIYQNVTGGCAENQPLALEHCYKAQMVKAYIDVLINKGMSKEDIYYKIARRYSVGFILNEEIRGNIKKRVTEESKKPKPRIVLESFNFYLGSVSRTPPPIPERKITWKDRHSRIAETPPPRVQVAGKITIWNKGKAPLVLQSLRPSHGCISATINGPANLDPGQSTNLELIVDFEHPRVRVGPLHETLMITSNDPENPVVVLTIDAEVTP